MDGNDEEGPSARTLCHHRDEVRVHSAELVVMDAVGDGHAVIAFVLAGGLAVHVAELGAAVLWVPRHLWGGTQSSTT